MHHRDGSERDLLVLEAYPHHRPNLSDAKETNAPGCPTVKQVTGLDGRRLTLADLPLPDTKRWVIRRKAEVVAAVRGGLLSLEEACSRYALNHEEFLSWQNCIDRFGLAGLRTTRIQFYARYRGMPRPGQPYPDGFGRSMELVERRQRLSSI
jgi:hypothetical protein